MKRNLLLASLMGALLLSSVSMTVPGPVRQSQKQQYFPETGHTVREPFLSYFLNTGGVASHGFPLTDDYVDEKTGLLVQYFEKSRLEWHPGNPDPYKVQLGLLGDELGWRRPPIPISQIPAPNDPNCLYFNQTGHTVCLAFREYWLQHGGLDRFGYPISEYTLEGGVVVQYFQRAVMQWHPEKRRGQQIQLAPLGTLYYEAAGLDPSRRSPNYGTASQGSTITALLARGSVLSPVVVSEGRQTAYVFVADQLGTPIAGAAVTLIIHYPHGSETVTLPPTGADGSSSRAFKLQAVPPGSLVSLEFIIGYAGVRTETRSSFMVWY